MRALDAKWPEENGAKRSFLMDISHKQLLCEVLRSEAEQHGAERCCQARTLCKRGGAKRSNILHNLSAYLKFRRLLYYLYI